ncbi:tetratricopeptide repeat protein [Sorangium sp. So ce1335]|uniref:tetratricopeptide repeat protein n=1 Tax=Sorangium sp. So ce1335 TaxID=3133335 RepID=UPI003F5EBD1D
MLFRRSRRARLAFALTSLLVLGAPAAASAAGERDAEAMKLHNQAMDEDYLSVEFDKAEKKLRDALKRCEKNACTRPVIGKLHIALGTVYGGGGKLDQARAEFVLALRADPKAALIDALTTTELAQAFKEAQKDVQSGAGKGAGETSGEGGKPAKQAAGDVPHTPVAEQAVNTPVPVFVEVPEEIDAAKATLRYRPFGSPKWKSLEMPRLGDGFGAEIPCEDVTTTGDVRYFVILRDEAGDPVGTAGSMQAPHRVPIKNEIETEPSLPGQDPPQRCAAKEDCPPGLPGCPEAGGERGDKGWGATCEETVECKSGLVCLNGTCEQGEEEGGGAAEGKGNRNVFGLWGQLDLLLVRGTDYVCSGGDSAYACFYPGTDGQQFYGEPADLPGTNGVKGGLSPAGVRVMLSYDRQFFANLPLLVGARLGFSFGGSPSSEAPETEWRDARGTPLPRESQHSHYRALPFMPFHGEIRATYFFLGDRIVEKGGFRPYAFVSPIGYAQVNASVPVDVCDRRDEQGRPQGGNGSNRCPSGSRFVEDLDAFQITGRNFSGVGAGVVYGITPNLGVSAEVKVMLMWPTLGLVFAPTIGPVFAL